MEDINDVTLNFKTTFKTIKALLTFIIFWIVKIIIKYI